MGIWIRPSRFLRVRITQRGVQWAIGPRAALLHPGVGAPGVSTKAGPMPAYRGLRRRRRR